MKIINQRTIYLLIVSFFVLVLFVTSANAGILSFLMKSVDNAADVGGKTARQLDGLSSLRYLPDEPGISRVGVDVTPDGKLNFISDSGRSWSVNSPDEVASVLRDIKTNSLLPNGKKAKTFKIFVSEDQLFRSNELSLLKDLDQLHLVRNDKSFPLKWVKNNRSEHWRVETSNNLFVDAKTPEALKEGLWRLSTSFNTGNMRLVSFSSDFDGMPSSIQAVTEKAVPDLTRINPESIETSFNILRNQTLIVTGKRKGDLLEIKPESLDINQLQNHAKENNVNLIILETENAAQLGSSRLPWKNVLKEKQLEEAFSTTTFGDFLSNFSQKKNPISLNLTNNSENYVAFRSSPSNVIDNKNVISKSNTVTNLTAHIVVRSISLYTHNQSHQKELDSRIIEGIPSWIHTLLLSNIIFGVLALFLPDGFWLKLWRKSGLKNRKKMMVPGYLSSC